VNASLIVKKLARTSRRMEALVQDLLAFSKVSQQEVDFSRVELASVIYDLLALRPPAVRKTLTVRKPLPAVLAHRALLQQVLANLIDNAIKYVAPQTSPSITVYCERVTHGSPSTRSRPLLFSSVEGAPRGKPATQVETLPTRVRLWVVDQGIGIPPKIHQKIFGIFERGVSSELYEGTGMGLAIVARAMQRMGGACGVESEPGKGSRFWIELPAA
jgi:signal transduction histidine kinase